MIISFPTPIQSSRFRCWIKHVWKSLFQWSQRYIFRNMNLLCSIRGLQRICSSRNEIFASFMLIGMWCSLSLVIDKRRLQMSMKYERYSLDKIWQILRRFLFNVSKKLYSLGGFIFSRSPGLLLRLRLIVLHIVQCQVDSCCLNALLWIFTFWTRNNYWCEMQLSACWDEGSQQYL